MLPVFEKMVSSMSRLVAALIFFLVFFRVSFIHPSLYLAIPFGCLGLCLLLRASTRRAVVQAPGYFLGYFFILLGLFFLVVDICGQNGLGNFTNLFAVRWISIVVLSVLPALLLSEIYFKGNFKLFSELFALVLWIQLLIWFVTYLSTDAKIAVYEIMGQGGSVNLLEYNIKSRGFGMSNEINFTGPFVTVMLCFFYIISSRKMISLLTIFTQLVNSNMVVVSFALSYFFSNIMLVRKIVLLLALAVVVVTLGEQVFARLYAEIASGGVRTLEALIEDHVFIANKGWFEHFFGTGIYVFQGGHESRSDIGWVIMYNYGGVFFCVCFIIFLFFSSFSAFGGGARAICWFIAGLMLNAKGLLFGPNSYFFATALIAFIRHYNCNYAGGNLNYVQR